MERNIQAANRVRESQPFAAAKVRDIIGQCVSHWKWFVFSLLITMGAAIYYLKSTPPLYERMASILIKSEDKSSGTDNALKEIGILQGSANITNEILSLQTSTVATGVVRRLDLDVNYYREGSFYKEVIYGLQLPVKVKFEELNDNETASLQLSLAKDGTVRLAGLVRNGGRSDETVSLKTGETASTKLLGKVTVQPSPYYKKGMSGSLEVVRNTIPGITALVRSRVSATQRDKNSTIIDIRYRDYSASRAEDILNTLVAVYNENWVKERNQRMVNTNNFIKERLGVIEQELGDVEQNISDYKSEHLLPDVQQVGSMAMSQANAAEQQSYELDNQLYMIRYVRSYLTDGQHDGQLLPANSGLSGAIVSQINEYNNIMLQRNNHLANSSAQNPLVIDLNQHLATLRTIIIQSLDNEQTILNARQRSVQSNRNQAVSKIASNPGQAKYLLSVERQQKVKESLYLFLLQKREENELSQAFTAYNTQLIELPHGSMAPISPVGSTILAIAFGLGLVIPGSILFLRESMNTAVRGHKDLEGLKVPFIGEIPLAVKEKRSLVGRKRHVKDGLKEKPQVLVAERNRDLMNEAFRVVRANLEFMIGFENSHSLVMVTSLNPGSGKTFITANLSTALGIKEKRVLAIDLDMRKGSLSEYVGKPKHGVSNYLSGQDADYKELLVKLGAVDVLPCGTLPPNPAELLYVPRFRQMIDEVRRDYDYVFIDCPPVEIVADASIINRYADMTLFVVRTHLLDRSFLPEIEQWYEEKRYKNLSVLLNGTTDAFSRYGYHKYGYHRYGYHYGNYSYGESK